ncbi:MAG TPA: glycosyltransferase family 39 protein [Solirubrobacteraceae bacterium]|nr:glycosyltransferase family 39 protein [Solirubrobacteraceae bacterium]
MAIDVGLRRRAARTQRHVRVRWPRWSASAWGSITTVVLFLTITCWWLTQDRGLPIFDAANHLTVALYVHDVLKAGDLHHALFPQGPYPPLVTLIGALGAFIGGYDVAPPIIAQNLLFVPLLALGCYHTGRLAFGHVAGFLAVVFALGSPLIIVQFHVFMIDAPETAMVAVSVWAILASERFSRVGVSALAGLAVALGLMTKEPYAFFVVGIVGATTIRGGRGCWRGLATFTAVVLVVALPWYIYDFSKVSVLRGEAFAASSATPGPGVPAGSAPPRTSIANLEWYFWSILNVELYLPLFLVAAVGWVWTLVGFVRRRPVSGVAFELAAGAFVSWLILTETYVHDARYGMPLLVYLAVFAGGWIARLPRAWLRPAAAVVILVAILNTIGASFGAGGQLTAPLPKVSSSSVLRNPAVITVYSDAGFLVAGPQRGGQMLALMKGLRRHGVIKVGWFLSQSQGPEFSTAGVTLFAQIAHLTFPTKSLNPAQIPKNQATLFHSLITSTVAPPCVTLSDGSGIWVRLGDISAKHVQDFCPLREPQFYDP